MNPGKIILLHGRTCAEKTNICTALQSIADGPCLHVDLEQMFDLRPKQPLPLADGHWAGTSRPSAVADHARYTCDPHNQQLISDAHHTIAGLASVGYHVIVDHMLIEPRWLRECALLFGDLTALLVGVRCPQSGSPTDSPLTALHPPGVYDLEVDPALCSPLQCAWQIKERLLAGAPPMAWRWLKVWSDPAKHRGWIRGHPDPTEPAHNLGQLP
jgi:chloramphenicol 3-O phosphotransferase